MREAPQGAHAPRGAWWAAMLSAAVAVAVAGLTAVPTADAFYGNGAQIVSADFERLEQGDDTTTYAAISGNGRYVAIQTVARNFFADDDPDPPGQYRAGGIFRFDLETRALAKVADGNVFAEGDNAFLRRGAANPSISADGRFVAFSTAERLVPADVNGNVDVYVRDMAAGAGDAGAYDLVSARDGGDTPATYAAPPFSTPGGDPGADVSRGVAISADGQVVAFRTDGASDLPAGPAADVPAGQVFVRRRATDATTLVTRADPSGDPVGGAVGAALSGDGTAVAWTGANAPAQTRFLNGENQDSSLLYYLWRRVADGPTAPTRRITGLADPDDAGCPPSAVTFFDDSSTGPCYGPLTDPDGLRASISSQLPALSGDGRTVAFLTGAGRRPVTFSGPGLDLYVTDMSTGVSRKQATEELTREGQASDTAASTPLSSIAMAGDGRHVAVTTGRTRFALPALTVRGATRQAPGPRELYVVDLVTRTIERVTRSGGGGDIDGDVLNGVTISSGGERVAFASLAGNLFFGDTNQRADAFVATHQPDPVAQPPSVGPGDDGPAGTVVEDSDRGGPRIVARARIRRDGAVALTVSVPAAGGVKAVANARAGRPRKLRTLATAVARARKRGQVSMLLEPVRRYRAELRRRKSIPIRIRVTFVAARGGRRLDTATRTTFRTHR